MFERNTLTFNPGWDPACNKLDGFTDVRELQAYLESSGVTPQVRVEEGSTGPGCCIVTDPDGNPIMLDQHV